MGETLTNFIDRFIPVLGIGVLAFVIAMALTPIYTYFAYKRKWWKLPRKDAITGEKAVEFQALHNHKHRRNIPTMAGVIMLLAVGIVTVWLNLSREQTYLPLAAFLGAGIIGLVDDIINIRGNGAGVAGLRSSRKFTLVLLIAVLGALYFYTKLEYDSIGVPFLENPIYLGWLIVPLFALVIVSTANAVNITDGLDGLAGGLLTSAFGAFGIIAFLQDKPGIAAFCMCVVGALLAYTWFNIFPARFFMGDVGSFALGSALGVIAMLTNSIFLLPVIGLVFVAEAGSSLLQILSKRFLKRKLFRIAPLHHHLEAKGWPEAKVTMRFWVIGQLCAVTGIILSIIGGLVT